jgi:hypothetical protein
MTFKRLNSLGVSHIIVPLLVIVLVGVAGVYTLVASHADACLTVKATAVSSTVSGALAGSPVSAPVSAPVCPTPQGVSTIKGFSKVATNGTYGVGIFACKTYINAYGGIYNVKYLFTKPVKLANASYQLVGTRGGKQYFNQNGAAWWNNVIASYSTNMSSLGATQAALQDKLMANVKVNNKVVSSIDLVSSRTQGQAALDPSMITNCTK